MKSNKLANQIQHLYNTAGKYLVNQLPYDQIISLSQMVGVIDLGPIDIDEFNRYMDED